METRPLKKKSELYNENADIVKDGQDETDDIEVADEINNSTMAAELTGHKKLELNLECSLNCLQPRRMY